MSQKRGRDLDEASHCPEAQGYPQQLVSKSITSGGELGWCITTIGPRGLQRVVVICELEELLQGLGVGEGPRKGRVYVGRDVGICPARHRVDSEGMFLIALLHPYPCKTLRLPAH